MINRARRFALEVFGRLPTGARRFVVRRVAPAWTVGAVAIIRRDDGRLLMVKPVYRDGWSLPGGIVDRGEQPKDAAVRELMEELGLHIRVEGEPWMVCNAAKRQVETVFRGELVDDIDLDAISVQSYELNGVGWFELDDLPTTEQEALDVVTVVRQSETGGPRILFR